MADPLILCDGLVKIYKIAGLEQVALRELSADVGDRMVLMADLCVDEYTSHGHCGVLDGPAGHPHTSVDNDATLEIYGRIAVAQADAGAQVVAPSGMMDGQVAAIRAALDSAGHSSTAILAYSAKYASGLYGPFRDAVDCAIVGGGDRCEVVAENIWEHVIVKIHGVRIVIVDHLGALRATT